MLLQVRHSNKNYRDFVFGKMQGATLINNHPVCYFLLNRTMKSKNPASLAPLLPLGFLTAYQYDMAHGNKMARIKSM